MRELESEPYELIWGKCDASDNGQDLFRKAMDVCAGMLCSTG